MPSAEAVPTPVSRIGVTSVCGRKTITDCRLTECCNLLTIISDHELLSRPVLKISLGNQCVPSVATAAAARLLRAAGRA